MPGLFMDPLDMWLMVLGITLITAAYGVFENFVKRPSSVATNGSGTAIEQRQQVVLNVNKHLSLFLLLSAFMP